MAEFDPHRANEVTTPAGDMAHEANAGELEGGALEGALAGRNAVEQVDEEERGAHAVDMASWAAQSRDGR